MAQISLRKAGGYKLHEILFVVRRGKNDSYGMLVCILEKSEKILAGHILQMEAADNHIGSNTRHDGFRLVAGIAVINKIGFLVKILFIKIETVGIITNDKDCICFLVRH